jgi:alkylhydroperoxidase/carboxymuconolactone decarboxylase family protein YurZ
MASKLLEPIKELDNELHELVEKARAMSFEDGALSRKMKFLIAIALDASRGSVTGVTALTKQAIEAGATKKEIMEALRITNFIYGVGSVYTVALALKGIE